MNTQDILNKHTCNGMRELTEERALSAMREACETTVDMCAKNHRKWYDSDNDLRTPTQSILDVKNKIV